MTTTYYSYGFNGIHTEIPESVYIRATKEAKDRYFQGQRYHPSGDALKPIIRPCEGPKVHTTDDVHVFRSNAANGIPNYHPGKPAIEVMVPGEQDPWVWEFETEDERDYVLVYLRLVRDQAGWLEYFRSKHEPGPLERFVIDKAHGEWAAYYCDGHGMRQRIPLNAPMYGSL